MDSVLVGTVIVANDVHRHVIIDSFSEAPPGNGLVGCIRVGQIIIFPTGDGGGVATDIPSAVRPMVIAFEILGAEFPGIGPA